MEVPFHSRPLKEIYSSLDSSPKGLSGTEAKRRLESDGPNELKEKKKTSPLRVFLKQFDSFVVWILIGAIMISVAIGYYNSLQSGNGGFSEEYVDAIVIMVVLILIAVLGFIQEYNAERAIDALRRLSSLKAKVFRDGTKVSIDSKDLVIGDILSLEVGDKVPADCRLIEAFNLKTQESALTGESQPVGKSIAPSKENAPLAERACMAFSSTTIVSGRASAIVCSIGMGTEIGKIATLIEESKPEPTPLQQKMDQLGRYIGIGTIIIAFIVFTVGLFLHEAGPLEMLIISVSLAVAAIPEGLPAVVVISLALGTKRMLSRHALIRRLPCVETLGSTTVICTDKTGTLTKNEMTVRKIFVDDRIVEVTGLGYSPKGEFLFKGKPYSSEELDLLLTIGAVNNDAELHSDGNFFGDPTEVALIVSSSKAGMHKKHLEEEMPRLDEIEFSSERKMMATFHSHHGEKLIYVKGAPEIILSKCASILVGGKVRKLTAEMKERILEINSDFASGALRVLGFAYRPLAGPHIEKERSERNLIFVGMQGMIDPPREEVKEAIHKCNSAGIRVIMITGDQEITARAVAKELGLGIKSCTGADIDNSSDLSSLVESTSIFARVNPEHKLKIVEALKKKGHTVAMTGDGVNDAPALKRADIGIAMGISGTDVSKEASSMVLLDDNFASIVNAVEEGRGTYGNIKKYFGFLISGNIAEVLIIFLGIIFGLPIPVTATQILLINLVTDGLPAIALSADPFEPNAMSRKPRPKNEPIYKGLTPYIVYYPAVMTIVALSVFCYFYFGEENLMKAQTATFLTISMFELYQAMSCRSTIYPSHKVGYFKNKYLLLAVFGSFALIALAIFVPSIGHFLDMVPLTFFEFFAICAISSLGGIVIEMSKILRNEPFGDLK